MLCRCHSVYCRQVENRMEKKNILNRVRYFHVHSIYIIMQLQMYSSTVLSYIKRGKL